MDIATRYAPQAQLVSVVDDDGLPLDNPARAKKVVERARAYDNVVRLYSGDPILDGSIATEAAVLNRSKLSFEVAPGSRRCPGSRLCRVPLMSPKAREVRIIEATR